ncbi:dUTP diphosphatase [Patescibacteria group bacterium]|nr:MAG: dUTP diphosphatase [Patescibacteria group bacterium]
MHIPVKILKVHPDAIIPEYKTSGACAFDLSPVEDAAFAPGETKLVGTGLVFCFPPGHVLVVAPRSSLFRKKGLVQPHSIGIVDQDYCGPDDEVKMLLKNDSDVPVTIARGERVCQGLFFPVVHAAFEEVSSMDAPTRGGYGSTG